MQGNTLSKHIKRHRVLYLRLIACFLLFQWANVIGAEAGWRTQHKTFWDSGYKIGLYVIDYERVGWKNPVCYSVLNSLGGAIAVSPFFVVYYAWATLSKASILILSACGVGIGAVVFYMGEASLAPMAQAVATCFVGASMMYSNIMPKALHWWKHTASRWRPLDDGKYYWPEAETWKPTEEWNALWKASMIMFAAGVLIVITFLFIICRTNSKREGKDSVLGIALLVPSLLGFFGVTWYYFKAQEMPPASWLSGANGYFDWAFHTAVALSFLSMLPILLEASYRGDFRLWQSGPLQSQSAARTHRRRKQKKTHDVEFQNFVVRY